MTTFVKSKIFISFLTFIISASALIPSVLRLTEHGDEAIYAWGGNYFLDKILKLDFSPTGTDSYTDPGWDPLSIWASTGPNLTRIMYGVPLKITKVPIPELPYAWGDPKLQGSKTHLSIITLRMLRFIAISCAALGFSFIAFRWRWKGLLIVLLMLLIPHVRDDLSRGWAEGPLLLGIGLIITTFGTRLFPLVLGIAGSLKFTAMGFWPLVLIPGAYSRKKLSRIMGLIITPLVWSFVTPPSWYMGGPIYIVYIFIWRLRWWLTDAHKMVSSPYYIEATPELQNPFGLFIPTRYLWPIELMLISGLILGFPYITLFIRKHMLHKEI